MTLVDIGCIAFLGWALVGFWRGLSLPSYRQYSDGLWLPPNFEAMAHFDLIKAVRRRSLWAGLIDHKYGGKPGS